MKGIVSKIMKTADFGSARKSVLPDEIVLACIIFSLFASSPPQVDPDAAAVTMVWSYIAELIFNMLVLVGTIKLSDRVVREMMGL